VDWIDKLSGQGPFWGPGAEWAVFCDQGRRFNQCNQPQPRSGAPVNRWEVGADGSFLFGRLNDKVEYPAGTTDEQKGVDAWTLGGHGTYWLHRSFGITARARAVHFQGKLVDNGTGLWDGMFSIGVVARLPLSGGYSLDFVPQAQFGIGPFDRSQFGALSPMGSDRVKFGFHVGIHF
jgi:hypothetical protein